MCELISTDTKEWAYSVFSRMSDKEFSKELMIIVLARKLYLDNALVDSFVFTYIDDVYEIMRDILVANCSLKNDLTIHTGM